MTNPHKYRKLGVVAALVAVTAAVPAALFAQTPEPPATPEPSAAAAPQTAVARQPAATTDATPVKVVEPKFTATPEQIGDSLMAHQRYQAAVEQYKKAPQNSSDAWNKMGVAYQLMFNLDDAERCYRTALKLSPKNAVVLNNLGTLYVSLKQFSKAEKMYRKALKADPRSALVHKNLGTAYLSAHKYKKGWQEYQDALAIDPKIFEHNNSVRVENPASVQDRGAMNYYMAKGCVRAGQTQCAIEYLRLALNEGFTSPKKIAEDGEFAVLRDVPAYQQMIASQRAQ